jgi:pyridoxamine-phosphate oxidase
MPNRDYQAERREYQFAGLRRQDLSDDPYAQFQKWMDEAFQTDILDPTAMTLATANKKGQPHARVVLLKSFDRDGFVFYTHYDSEKGEDLAENPLASLLFFWPQMDRQIRIEGWTEKVSAEQSDAYFHSRPRDSQLSAYISHQGKPVAGRDELERRMAEAEKRFAGQSIPRPEHWGGYRVHATLFEFWQGRPNRLHDRFLYKPCEKIKKNVQNSQSCWQIERLSP